MANAGNSKKLKKADYIFSAVVIVIATAFIIMFKINNKTNLYVKVQIGNDSSYYYSLDEELQRMIYMDDDNGNKCYNELLIHEGKASIISADCYNQICVNTGEICKEGDSIVCLPHKMAVTIVGADSYLK